MPVDGARKWIITFTVVMAAMIELIDTSIVNVALPQMMGNLGATLDEITWVVTAYIVANVIVIPMTGFLASYFGRRNYLGGSIILFTIASFFCGHASGIWELVIFRLIQGAAGGALMSTSQSVLVETFPPEELGLANALFGMGVVAGPTIGPTLGGWITDNYSWRWIFYVNIPIGTIAALLTFAYILDPLEKHDTSRVDWLGIFFLILSIGSLQIMLERGEHDDWFSSPFICMLAALAISGGIAFIWRELTASHPVVNLRVFRDRSLAVGTLFTFILGFGLYSSVFIFPVFVQNLLGFTAMQTGLILLPGALTTALMMPFVGKALQKGFSAQVMNATGFFLFFVFTWQLSRSTLSSGQWDFFWPLVWRGAGLALLFVPLTTLALGNLRGKDIPQGAGLTNMMRQLGGSFGVAAIATFIDQRSWAHRTDLVRHINPYSFEFQHRFHALLSGMIAKGSTFLEAQKQAYAALEGAVTVQSYLLTYMNAFLICGVFFLFCIPLLALFKKPKERKLAAPTH